MAFRPYFQWNGTIYTAQQALNFLNNQYPNARYTQIMERVGRTIHWGFNYTNLPPAIQANLQAVYFKLEEYNFPLSNIEIEEYLDELDSKNYTRILIPKANLAFDFADIISQDFTVKVNQTGIAIYNVAGKPDLYLDPITYSAPTITVIGYSSATPCTFTDIYNADVAGGWGVVTLQSAEQFLFSAKVTLGNSTTAGASVFADYGKQIVFASGVLTTHDQAWFTCTAYSNLTLGVLVNSTLKSTKQGVSIISLNSAYRVYFITGATSNSLIYLYSCDFQAPVVSHYLDRLNRIYNCKVGQGFVVNTRAVDLFNCILDSAQYIRVAAPSSGSPTINKVTVTNPSSTYYMYYAGTSATDVSNVYGRGGSITVYLSVNGTVTLIDPDVDVWAFTFIGSTAIVNRKYTFNLKVQDSAGTAIENATVSLINNTSIEVLTDSLTDSNGLIDTQTVFSGFYNSTGGNTLYDAGPFLLNVTKTGYQSYVQNFSLREPVDWLVTLSATDTETANNAALIWSLLFGALAFALFLAWWVRH